MYILIAHGQEATFYDNYNDMLEYVDSYGLFNNFMALDKSEDGPKNNMRCDEWLDITDEVETDARNWDGDCRKEKEQMV